MIGKIILIAVGALLLLFGLYVMYYSTIEVTQNNKNPLKLGDELFASPYPIGVGIAVIGTIVCAVGIFLARKENANE